MRYSSTKRHRRKDSDHGKRHMRIMIVDENRYAIMFLVYGSASGLSILLVALAWISPTAHDSLIRAANAADQ
jgi:hypothetical protein